MSDFQLRAERLLTKLCGTDDALDAWLRFFLRIEVPRASACDTHQAPFEYVRAAYREPAPDLVLWAPRGGGKTRLAAAATLLDLLHKPGVSIRILGGSLDQSLRVWEHLAGDIQRIAPHLVAGRLTASGKVRLINGSSAAVLTQSQRSVRGLRVTRLRCDEIDLFQPRVWEAAQLVTRSMGKVRGSVEAISTFHAPWGLMSRIIDEARSRGASLLHWCILDVLERCPPQRQCSSCELWDDCRGVAKQRCDGFVSIDDAIALKRRVSRETWDAEMLCRRPVVSQCVFREFDEQLHVRDDPDAPRSDEELSLAIDFGYAGAFVCLWIVTAFDGTARVIDEYVQPQRTVGEHLEQIRSRAWGVARRLACDPAGAARNEQTAMSNVQLLKNGGFDVRWRKSRIQDGLELIRAALRPASGPVRLFIHPRCVRLIKAMRAYHYAENGSELPLKDGEHDHLIDALRYHFINAQTRPSTARAY